MIKPRNGVASLFLGLALHQGWAHSYGEPPGVTSAPGDTAKACTLCHVGTINSGTGGVKIVPLSGAVTFLASDSEFWSRLRILISNGGDFSSRPTEQRPAEQLGGRVNFRR